MASATNTATKTLRFLTAAQVQRLHIAFVNLNGQPTQPSMLDSAVQSPMNIKYYTNQDNVFQLAATLSEKIMKNHAYQDGNKRTALLAADMFLKINGYKLQKTSHQADPANQSLADAQVAACTNVWTAEQLGQFYQSVASVVDELSTKIRRSRNAATEY
ncbi:hypothetical protein MMC24_005563 [Lignoscripta atroalba]|nr:hypothetical protein [Lignoscripta atroalba]